MYCTLPIVLRLVLSTSYVPRTVSVHAITTLLLSESGMTLTDALSVNPCPMPIAPKDVLTMSATLPDSVEVVAAGVANSLYCWYPVRRYSV